MGIKDGFFAFLLRFADEQGITELADIGCGIGLDAQALLQAGYDVHAYDLDNPSLNYARWRFAQDLGANANLHPIDQLTGRQHPLAYAVDVLGHTDDPPRLVKTLLTTADYVCLNLGPHDQRHRHGTQDLHPSLDHQRILAELTLHGDLIRLAATGKNVITLWRSSCCST